MTFRGKKGLISKYKNIPLTSKSLPAPAGLSN